MAEYINRGTFKESVEERFCKPCKAEGKDHNGCWCRACWVDDMLEEVDCFQPADVAPVVHGRWEYIPQTLNTLSQLRCPFCRWWSFDPSIDGVYNYCPNCGAKMDGGDGDAVD